MCDKLSSRCITVAQLKAARQSGKLWIAIRGGVYNVTDFARKHPGGSEIIYMASGKDMTTLFGSYHQQKETLVLQKYFIGRLVGHDAPQFPPDNDFARTLKARVSQYFSSHGIDPRHSPASFVRYACLLASLLLMYAVQWWLLDPGSVLFYIAAAAYGLIQAQYCVTAVHDGAHAAIGRDIRVWRALVAGHDFVNGCSGTLWIYHHVMSHHIYTNVEGYDIDIDTTELDFRRIKMWQVYRWFYKAQWLYAPLVYVFLACSIRFVDTFDAWRGPIDVNPFTPSQRAIFWGGKIFFLFSRFFIPVTYTSASTWQIVCSFLLSDCLLSFVLALIFQASHVVENVSWPQVNKETGDIDSDWMTLQVETAQDYSHGDAITTFLTGALNYQVVHHLFPYVAQPYLAALAPIVKSTAKEFGVKYEIRSSLWEAIGGHLGLLKMLGSPPHSEL